jgi:uncharacterized membrane protein
MVGGRTVGVIVLIATVVLLALSWQYPRTLEQERTQAIANLVSMPEYANCRYDASTCPQAEETVILPEFSGLAIVIIGIVLGLYLIRSDTTQRRILDQLEEKQDRLTKDERSALLLSVLTSDERAIIEAVRAQPGISQATLRLRVNMSKAKLSMLLKDLASRGLITKIEDGKTNAVQLKIDL